MRLTWKIRRKLLRLVAAGTLLSAVALLALYATSKASPQAISEARRRQQQNSFMFPEDLHYSHKGSRITPKCTMATCFDVSRCMDSFKVYVYPFEEEKRGGRGGGRQQGASSIYKKIVRVLRDSPYYTDDPNTACLLVLNIDTLDRDPLSNDYVKRLPEKLKALRTWNNGRNHILFNMYSGSFPDYNDQLDFDYGEAIIAKASFALENYRTGFDISLPLIHKLHSEKGKFTGGVSAHGNLFPIHRKYLLIFKGKRYLWGLGSATRNAIYHLDNGDDVIMLTTCKHGKFWSRYRDEKCKKDNIFFEKYNYNHLISNSTFCLVPRGRRLGSFRFLESLHAGCIPVSLSNGLVLPFHELIDWSKALFVFDERQLFQVPHMLRHVPHDKILSMRLHTQFYWEQYFSSVDAIMHTTLEIVKQRISQFQHGVVATASNSYFLWNHYPGGLVVSPNFSEKLEDYPFFIKHQQGPPSGYTAVVIATKPAPKGNSPLVLLLKNLCNSTHAKKIVVSWIGSGNPKVMVPPFCRPTIKVIDARKDKKHMINVMIPYMEIRSDAILSLWEDTELITEEVDFGYLTWLSNPERLVGFVGRRHFWSPKQGQWICSSGLNNRYSLLSLGASFYHKYYAHYVWHQKLSSSARRILDSSKDCFSIGLNFVISHMTGSPPLKVTQRVSLNYSTSKEKTEIVMSCVSCINSLTISFGYIPLKYSWSRADPVLFRDNVAAHRKEFRRIENVT